jgi:hypothetical protein
MTFRAHKEVLFFASPFFEAALSGSWAETGRPPSMSSVITISQPPSDPGDKSRQEVPAMTFAPMDPELEDMDLAFDSDTGGKSTTASESEGSDAELIALDDATKDPVTSEEKAKARDISLAQLQSGATAPTRKREGKKLKMRRYVGTIEEEAGLAPKPIYQPAQATVRRRHKANGPDAVIVLKEERVCIYDVCRIFVSYLSWLQASTFHDFLKYVYPQ